MVSKSVSGKSASASAKPDDDVIHETSEESKSNKSTDLRRKEGQSDGSAEDPLKQGKPIVEAAESDEFDEETKVSYRGQDQIR